MVSDGRDGGWLPPEGSVDEPPWRKTGGAPSSGAPSKPPDFESVLVKYSPPAVRVSVDSSPKEPD